MSLERPFQSRKAFLIDHTVKVGSVGADMKQERKFQSTADVQKMVHPGIVERKLGPELSHAFCAGSFRFFQFPYDLVRAVGLYVHKPGKMFRVFFCRCPGFFRIHAVRQHIGSVLYGRRQDHRVADAQHFIYRHPLFGREKTAARSSQMAMNVQPFHRPFETVFSLLFHGAPLSKVPLPYNGTTASGNCKKANVTLQFFRPSWVKQRRFQVDRPVFSVLLSLL